MTANYEILPIMPLKGVVVFPNCITPLIVMRSRSLAALERALSQDKRLFFTAQKQADIENPDTNDLYHVGTVAEVVQAVKTSDGTAKILIEGSFIGKIVDFIKTDEYFQARVMKLRPVLHEGRETEALARTALREFERYVNLSEKVPEELYYNIKNITEPVRLANAIAHYCSLKSEDKQRILETLDVRQNLFRITQLLERENELLELEHKILDQVKSQIGKSQKEYYLSEQLKAIEKELGLSAEEDSEFAEIQRKAQKLQLSQEAKGKIKKELERLKKMPSLSPEATVSRTYVDWLLELPWGKPTKDKLDLHRAQKILDEDHYSLEKVKERIIEYLAVNKLTRGIKGPILCFVGPPGVGKTSLGKSIARALGRRFVRVSLGGVRDEAEIRGHRRTYIGALPGKVIQCIKKAGSMNPVFLLDEVDKMSIDFRGDPSAALLEVLDPEQNKAFNDHYLEIDFDLSHVLFITTANTTEGIPPALIDRMEILRLPGYTEDEKLEIALRFLVPKQTKANGLTKRDVEFSPEAIKFIINSYTREAGVRNLEREIANICRKLAKEIVGGKKRKKRIINREEIKKYLGPQRFSDICLESSPEIGVATALAWTEVGGELLSTETTIMRGKGELMLTGMLGEVMQESAKTALSYIRSRSKQFDIKEDFYKNTDIHIHIPEGAIPKDGPSAGITLATSMVSALSNRPVRQDVAMTGEITLRGKVLRIGGLKEKILAAHRAGIHTVIIPKENKDELQEIPKKVKKQIKFVLVNRLDEALKIALAAKKMNARLKVRPS